PQKPLICHLNPFNTHYKIIQENLINNQIPATAKVQNDAYSVKIKHKQRCICLGQPENMDKPSIEQQDNLGKPNIGQYSSRQQH
ncbi:hypothetical protein VIGAN_UM087800, partial [Vigna angularis var. angularis]